MGSANILIDAVLNHFSFSKRGIRKAHQRVHNNLNLKISDFFALIWVFTKDSSTWKLVMHSFQLNFRGKCSLCSRSCVPLTKKVIFYVEYAFNISIFWYVQIRLHFSIRHFHTRIVEEWKTHRLTFIRFHLCAINNLISATDQLKCRRLAEKKM